jgi:hypothetical protein
MADIEIKVNHAGGERRRLVFKLEAYQFEVDLYADAEYGTTRYFLWSGAVEGRKRVAAEIAALDAKAVQ